MVNGMILVVNFLAKTHLFKSNVYIYSKSVFNILTAFLIIAA